MRRVLITGGNGTLGRHIAMACMAKGFDVVICGRTPPATVDAGIAFCRLDLLSDDIGPVLGSLEACSIIHAAWETAHPAYWTALSNCGWQAASLRLFDAFAASGGQHFTFVSTCADRAWAPAGSLEFPKTLYGASKRLVGTFLQQRSLASGVPLAIGRVYFPYSAGENSGRVTSLVVDACLKKQAFHLKTGDVLRDIFSARSAGRAFAALCEARATGVYDIASGTATHLGQFARDCIAARLDARELVTWNAYDTGREDPMVAPRELVGDATPISRYCEPPSIESDEIDRLVASRRALLG